MAIFVVDFGFVRQARTAWIGVATISDEMPAVAFARFFPVGYPPGVPALPTSGSLVGGQRRRHPYVVTDGLNQPTSLEFIGNTAYVVSLTGEIRKIDGVSCPSYGMPR